MHIRASFKTFITGLKPSKHVPQTFYVVHEAQLFTLQLKQKAKLPSTELTEKP